MADLRDELDRLLGDLAAGDELVVDVGADAYLDSLGIGLLVHTRNRCLSAGVVLRIRGVSDRSRRVLALSGLAPLFAFDDADDGPPVAPLCLPAGTPTPAEPDPMFDQIAALVRRVLDVPTALVSFVDRTRQVFPGAVGLPPSWQRSRTTPLSHSFCQYVVATAQPLVIRDARADPALVHNLALPDLGVVAYAGIPLTDVDGAVVGSLCAIDSIPRDWTPLELANLADLADACSAEVQRRGALRRSALSDERDRIAGALHQQVIGELFSATLALGQARALTTGRADELVATAMDTVDGAITAIRTAVFHG